MFSQGWSRQKCSCHRSRPLPPVEGGRFQDWNETLNNPERGKECRDRLPSRALCCGLQAVACPGGGLLQRRRGAQWGPCPPCSPLSGPLLNFLSPHQSADPLPGLIIFIPSQREVAPFFSFIYLLTWFFGVWVAAHGIFVALCRLLHCGIMILSSCVWP